MSVGFSSGCEQEVGASEALFNANPVYAHISNAALEALRLEIQAEGGPDEIYALFKNGTWDNMGQRVVRCLGDRRSITYHDWMGDGLPEYEERFLAPSEWETLEPWLLKADEMVPEQCVVYDAAEYTYVHFSSEKDVVTWIGPLVCIQQQLLPEEGGIKGLFPGEWPESQYPKRDRLPFDVVQAFFALAERKGENVARRDASDVASEPR